MTIAENLNRIIDAKEAIKDAIVSKGGQVAADAKIDEIPAAIVALPSGGDDTLDKIFDQTLEEIHNTTPIKYGRYLFARQTKLKVADIVFSGINNIVYQYQYMFSGCTALTTVPEILPATTLTAYCYNYMFDGCQSLTAAPALPATTLANYCYNFMFQGCITLTAAPDLPATTLANACYSQMFQNCTALRATPDLPATTLVNNCYYSMFNSCTRLQKTGNIAATGSISSYAGNMFNGCTSLKEMTWTATTPPTISSNIWGNCPSDMIIYVPDDSVAAYKAASVWSSRAAYIKPISEKPTE